MTEKISMKSVYIFKTVGGESVCMGTLYDWLLTTIHQLGWDTVIVEKEG